jgi:N-acetylglutamate synthase-like GNAT family acetyltransferase
MHVRSASFRDLGRIEQLHRETAAREEGEGVIPGLSSDHPVPQATLVRLWYALSKTLSSLVPLSDLGDALYVAEDPEQGIVGFIHAQGAPGQTRAWQILNLCVAPTGLGHFAGDPLLTHLTNHGVEHGVSRFYVRIPLDHPMVALFLEQGFTQYATEQILYRDDAHTQPRVVPSGELGPLRPARRDDAGAIYLLYLRTTPSHVANLEGPSQKAWQAGFQQGWPARLGRDDVRQFVAELSGIQAWVAMRPPSPARPTLLAIMCEGQDPEFREEVIDAALAQAPPGPVSCVLRHYDSELIRSLQRRGFEIFGSQLLLVRDLALKVRLRADTARNKKKGVLVHAGLARSVPAPVRVPASTSSGRSSPSLPR